VSLIGSVIGILVAANGKGPYVDLSFILWFWLSVALGRKRNWARLVALSVSVLVVVALLWASVRPAGPARFFGFSFQPGELGYILVSLGLLVVFSLPLALFSKRAHQQFNEK